jgi:nucleoid DNA-binding protein
MNRLSLAKMIHVRMGGAIPYRKVYQAVGVIVEHIVDDLVSDRVVSVRRFGTLSPHTRRSHFAHNVCTGVVRRVSSRRSVKFHAHDAFIKLIFDKQDRFRNRSA